MKLMSNHISILYPNQDDFNNFDERQEPQIFNYICLHGKQLFITSANRQNEDNVPEKPYKAYHLRTHKFSEFS